MAIDDLTKGYIIPLEIHFELLSGIVCVGVRRHHVWKCERKNEYWEQGGDTNVENW